MSRPVVSVPRARIRADFPQADAVGCARREACAHRRRWRTQSRQRATDATANTAEMENKRSAAGAATQLDVLVVGQHQDDVGPDVAGVAVPLQPRAESVSGQVAGGVAGEGQEEEAAEKQEAEAG